MRAPDSRVSASRSLSFGIRIGPRARPVSARDLQELAACVWGNAKPGSIHSGAMDDEVGRQNELQDHVEEARVRIAASIERMIASAIAVIDANEHLLTQPGRSA